MRKLARSPLGLRPSLLLALLLVVAACTGESSAPGAAQVSYTLPVFKARSPVPVAGTPRYVLAVIDSSEGRVPDNNEVHTFAEFALNYLGYGVIFHDLATRPLPGLDAMARYAAILTWFLDNQMADPMAYIEWLEQNVAAGRKFINLGNLGTFQDSGTGEFLPRDDATRPLKLLGARFLGNDTDNPLLIEVVRKIPALVEYERPLLPPLFYEQIRSIDPANEVWLTLNNRALADGLSDLVFIAPQGAYVHPGYVFWQDPVSFRRQLRIDLFTLFERAIRQGLRPIPDITTLNGGRVLYAQIDGDGFRNTYEPDPTIIAAEKVQSDILKVYPYLFTSSVIASDISGSFWGSPRMERVARDIFALDNVEMASHGWFHPFGWRGKLTELPEGLPLDFLDTHQTRETTLHREITLSIRFINDKLAPPEKRVRVFLWTGEANPQGDAIDAVDGEGIFNLNGGLGRYDSSLDSVSNLVAFVRQPEGRVQHLATSANDNNLTNLWQGPYEGYKNILETFERTESPRRLAPLNVYMHFFSGSKVASLSALRQVFDWIGGRDVNSIWSSEYIVMVQGFLSSEILPAGANRWIISNYGHLRTVRFDSPDLTVDLNRSRNVVGWRVINRSLYVFLGEGESAAVAIARPGAAVPHLGFCGCMVSSWQASEEAGAYSIETRVPTEMMIEGLPPERSLSYTITGSTTVQGAVVADARGQARFPVPRGARSVLVS